jgi:carboxymethylenebutenolidase
MGGRHVFRVAGNFPHRFKASASLHGTRLVTDGNDSPHLTAMKAQGEIYCGFAEHDPYAALPTIKVIADSMRGAQVKYSYELHKGAEHGYALPDRDIYDRQAANRDWERMFAMWRRQLSAS